VILCDETSGQTMADGQPFPEAIARLRMLPGIKVDTGAEPLTGAPGPAAGYPADCWKTRLARKSPGSSRTRSSLDTCTAWLSKSLLA
jgi:fructose-bisphosphate aldolase class 1